MIPQKSFDAQMHIIRDVHFDVDKYKIDELYVIKHKITNAHTIDGKMVGKLIKAEGDALTFDIFTDVIPEGILPTDPHNYYMIKTITLSLDDIIERQIEIERLLTESEAAVYLTGLFAKECAKDLIPTPSDFRTDKSLMNRTIDLAAAYKIDSKEEAEELAENSMLKIAEEVYDSSLDEYRNYTVDIPEMGGPFSFLNINWKFSTRAFENLRGKIEVTFRKGSNFIRFNTSSKFIFVTEDTIRILNRNGLDVNIYNNDFRESFDKIEFRVIQ
jgi:hypothetical protein